MQRESYELAGYASVILGLAFLGTLAAVLLAASVFRPSDAEGPYRVRAMESCVCREVAR